MLTQEYLKSRLEYDALTGVFTWKRRLGNERTINTWNTRYAGQVAGTIKVVDKSYNLQYILINLLDKPRRAHRLAWLYVYGECPERIDHIDGDGLNNKLDNLRPVSQAVNIRKGRILKNNTSGFKGVSYRKDTGKWSARCKVGGKYKSLGSFDSREEAFVAYCKKVFELTGEVHIKLITKEV